MTSRFYRRADGVWVKNEAIDEKMAPFDEELNSALAAACGDATYANRIHNILRVHNVETLEQLQEQRLEDVVSWKGIGDVALDMFVELGMQGERPKAQHTTYRNNQELKKLVADLMDLRCARSCADCPHEEDYGCEFMRRALELGVKPNGPGEHGEGGHKWLTNLTG